MLVLFTVFYHMVQLGALAIGEEIFINETTTYPEVTTTLGAVRGINMVTYRNRTIFGFLGIPFAEPPVGNLRFEAPVSKSAWNGTLEATSSTQPCPQFNGNEIIGSEDCLHLNLYTPMLPESENPTLLPVMVYFVGGGFKTGSNSPAEFGPDFLLEEDVLLIVPNSRLGALGYLSTGDEICPGNNGLKDIVEALRWIQENVQYFGGDPHRVTLFGGSSGSVSLHLLTLSDLTAGLFHRYIFSSGSALSLVLERPKEVYANVSIELGEYVGCPTNTSTVLIDCLRDLNVSEIIDTDVLGYKWKTVPDLVWLPTAEPDIEGALLTDTPRRLIDAGHFYDLPRMSSVSQDEGLAGSLKFYEDPDFFEELLDDFDTAAPYLLWYWIGVENVTDFTDTLKSYYMNDLTADRSLLLTNLTQLMGDALFTYPVFDGIQKQLNYTDTPHYFCNFNYRGNLSRAYLFSGGSTNYTGVAHSEEIIYLFRNKNHIYGPPGYDYSESDLVMVDTIVQLWTSFATNGIPTADLLDTVWEPYASRTNYLRIGNGSDLTIKVEYDFLPDRMQLWDDLIASTIWK